VAAIAALVMTIFAGALILDGVGAAVYYYVNWIQLQKAADAAAKAGSSYLPGNPVLALSTARTYVGLNGVTPPEIQLAQISADQRRITIRLARRLPFYLTGFAVGLRTRWVVATSTAIRAYMGLRASASALMDSRCASNGSGAYAKPLPSKTMMDGA
jgi:hypothetical protein